MPQLPGSKEPGRKNMTAFVGASLEAARPYRNLRVFFGTVALLAALQIALPFVRLPFRALPWVDLTLEMLYLAAPVYAIYRAADAPWTRTVATSFLIGGVATQAVGVILAVGEFKSHGPVAGVCMAVSQIGLQTWCVGLGAFLTTWIRERNILVPVAIVLAIVDMFLVFAPVGPTQVIMRHAPALLPNVGLRIPTATTRPTGGVARIIANVGPADLVFLGAYFVALFRFQMRTRATVIAMVPTLIVYMFIVLFGHLPLPALVPIGVVLLVVNWREFKLTLEEKLSTAVVAALGLALLGWGVTRPTPSPEQQPGPGPSVADPGSRESPTSTGPTDPDPLQSSPQSARVSKQGPP